MFIGDVKRRLSREFALRFAGRRSRQAIKGRYITFSFDDFPHSAAEVGANIISDNGGRGTFYCAGGLLATSGNVGRIATAATALQLHNDGHEIGCHTFHHQDCTQIGKTELLSDLNLNRQALQFCTLESFAFPFGYWDWSSKQTVAEHFRTVRTGVKGINSGHIDLIGLRAVPLYEEVGKNGVDRWLQRLQDNDGWIIFYSHDVESQPSKFGCTPELLTYCVKQAVKLGYTIETVKQVAARVN